MPWVRASLRGQQVFARATESGELASVGGKVEIRYRPNDGRRYDALAKNLTIVSPTVLPEETCAEASSVESSKNAGSAQKGAGAGDASKPSKGAGRQRPSARESIRRVENPKLIFYTDGACTGNPGPAGLGVVMLAGDKRRERSEYLGQGTNNIAELTAIERAVAMAGDLEGPVLVNTDSQYAIGVLSRGWKAKANTELVERIKSALAKRDDIGLSYVPGHSGVPLNERADELARMAIQTRKTQEQDR